MATRRDGRSFLDKVTSPAILLALVGLIVHQGSSLRSEIREVRETVHKLEIAVARMEARDSIRLRLAERFAAAGEGASYGGPGVAADLLLARALPEIDAVLSTLDTNAQSELAEDLWEDRTNILARAAPPP